jgi:Sulfotransferase family
VPFLAVDQSFFCAHCASTAVLPTYTEWLFSCDARYAFRRYQKVLALIATGDPRRWVLKDVVHLSGLDALLTSFPDACFVQTHRDPVKALTSVADLILHIRGLREDHVDLIEHGQLILNTWGRAMNVAEAARLNHDPARFIDVHSDDLHADPIGTLSRIYERFSIPVSDAAVHAWARQVDADPRVGHAAHPCKPEDFGFTPRLINDVVGAYYERYVSVPRLSATSEPHRGLGPRETHA